MSDATNLSDRMAALQKMRVALVVLTSTETSKLLSRRQRVAGKEIEVMCAERDYDADSDGDRTLLDTLYQEDANLRAALLETEQDIERLEGLLAEVNADIAALCQS